MAIIAGINIAKQIGNERTTPVLRDIVSRTLTRCNRSLDNMIIGGISGSNVMRKKCPECQSQGWPKSRKKPTHMKNENVADCPNEISVNLLPSLYESCLMRKKTYISNEAAHEVGCWLNNLCKKLPSILKTIAGNAQISASRKFTGFRLYSRFNPQPLRPRTPSKQPRDF